jgi:hypothetical protein
MKKTKVRATKEGISTVSHPGYLNAGFMITKVEILEGGGRRKVGYIQTTRTTGLDILEISEKYVYRTQAEARNAYYNPDAYKNITFNAKLTEFRQQR